MIERLRTILEKDCQLVKTQPILVGVSGGPDSLCLLIALHQLGYPVIVAHLNHGLRPEADSDALAVRGITDRLGVPFIQGIEDVADFANKNAFSVEEAARMLRYHFLFDQAGRIHAQAVAVGHTADDQVETVLMHLLRGAGLDGLKGMTIRTLPTAWSQEIPLVRPLLSIWREEVLAYCQAHGLHPVLDRSNLDTTFFRNRLRHELIPILENYNPAVRQNIWRTALVLAGDHDVLSQVISRAWEGCLIEQGPGWEAFDLRQLREQSLGLQRHLLRRAIALLRPGLRDIGFDTVTRALDFIAHPSRSKQCDLSAGLCLRSENGRLWIATWEADLPGSQWPQMISKTSLYLDVPGELSLPMGWTLHAERVTNSQSTYRQALMNADPFQAWVDAENIKIPLVVRSRCPGERFFPLGMDNHSLKLADFMINVKVPRRARMAWPLVCSGPDILWVPGYRLGHTHRLQQTARRAIYLQLSRIY